MREGLDPELVAEHSYTISRNHIGRYLLFDKQYETLFDLVHYLTTVPSALPHRLQQGPQNFSELFFDSVPQPFPNPKRDIYSLAMKSEKIASENYSQEVNPFFLSQAFSILNRALLLRPQLVPGNYPSVALSAVSYDEKGLLGTGEFGAVYKGKLNMQKSIMVDVAVKVLKRINRNSKNYDAWVSEMEVLQMVSHPNLIRFYGFCYDEKAEKVLLAFELMKVGSLMSYLKSKQFEVSVNEYIDFLLQISCGMDYLHNPPIIHGDLAARNVLMTYSPIDHTRFVLKISDFGLSRITKPQYTSGEQWSEHIPLESEKLPFKWLPPEVLHRRELNPMSDVWSYGITVCEIYGVVDPYGMVASEKVLPYCNDGYRMEKPDGMPAYVFDVVLKCWRFQPVDRPSFEEIQLLLEPFYIEMEEVHLAVVTKRLEELEKIKPRM
uniref:Protein kinase domain-containing protein n=1 Tax=Ditylenchus dipsaci TaxID=166011 RepID=A0A915DA40_9BILA